MVGLALLLLAGGQTAGVRATSGLPDGVSLVALENGYSYGTDGDRATLGFQLLNNGDRAVRVVDVGQDGGGLRLLEIAAAGGRLAEPSVGTEITPLPPFDLAAGEVVELTVVYQVTDCAQVTTGSFPLPVRLNVGRRSGTVLVPLPRAPSDAPDAGPDDVDEWQRVLVRDVCGQA